MSRSFRFSCAMPRLTVDRDQWVSALRRIESDGFSSVSISDHFTGGWMMEPVVTMTAAAGATDSLRVLSLVLGVDYRHPVQVHRSMATLDLFSAGRVEIGLGAGWMADEYRASGLTFDPPAERLARLAEAVEVVAALFGPGPVTFRGRHFDVVALDGLPKPVQQPRPPILVGGGGTRVLELAARHADIVGFFLRSDPERGPEGRLRDLSPACVAEKVDAVRRAAEAAGRDADELELQLSLLAVHVTDRSEDGWYSSMLGADVGASPELLDSPAVLVGTLDECTAKLEHLRDRYGFTYFNLGGLPAASAPVVARLAGR